MSWEIVQFSFLKVTPQYRPSSLGGHVESVENKKPWFCTASLALKACLGEAYLAKTELFIPETQHGRRLTKVYVLWINDFCFLSDSFRWHVRLKESQGRKEKQRRVGQYDLKIHRKRSQKVNQLTLKDKPFLSQGVIRTQSSWVGWGACGEEDWADVFLAIWNFKLVTRRISYFVVCAKPGEALVGNDVTS